MEDQSGVNSFLVASKVMKYTYVQYAVKEENYKFNILTNVDFFSRC